MKSVRGSEHPARHLGPIAVDARAQIQRALEEMKRAFDEAGLAFARLAVIIDEAFEPLRGCHCHWFWPVGSDAWVEVAWLILRRGHPRLGLRALRHAFRAHCEEIAL